MGREHGTLVPWGRRRVIPTPLPRQGPCRAVSAAPPSSNSSSAGPVCAQGGTPPSAELASLSAIQDAREAGHTGEWRTSAMLADTPALALQEQSVEPLPLQTLGSLPGPATVVGSRGTFPQTPWLVNTRLHVHVS